MNTFNARKQALLAVRDHVAASGGSGASGLYRHPFAPSDWLMAGPEEYRIAVPLEAHGMGPLACVPASNKENTDGEQENAIFGVRRTPRGDIIITSATPVAGEIFINKGAN